MPLYQYRCAEHGDTEVFKDLDELHVPEFCERCEDAYNGVRDLHITTGYTPPMRRVYTAPTKVGPSFGKVGVPHEAGRRLSKAEAERREDWGQRNLRNGQRLAATQEKPVTFDIGRGGTP